MNWIVPENQLDLIEREIINITPQQNLCIKGIAQTRKLVVLIYLIRKVMCTEPNVKLIVLVYNRINIEMYRMAFKELGQVVNVTTYSKFKNSLQKFDYIFCDNVQNISSNTLIEIKTRARFVTVTIDPYIKLFETDSLTNEPTLTVHEIEDILAPKIFELYFTHPKTSSLQKIVSRILKINQFVEFEYLSKNETQVRIGKAQNEEEESQYISREIKRNMKCGFTNVVLLPTQKKIISFIQHLLLTEEKQPWVVQTNNWGKIDYSTLNRYLEKNDIAFQCLGNGYGHLNDCKEKTSIMTYFSSQELEFDNAFIPYMNTEIYISSNEQISRNAFALAVTRCRNNLYLTYNGVQHEFINDIETCCSKIDIHETFSNNPINIFEGI